MSRRAFLAGASAIGAGAALGTVLGLRGAHALRTTEYTIGAGDSSLRIGVITDLHLRRFTEFEAEVALRLSDMEPDAIFLVGDLVESEDGLRELPGFLELLPPGVPQFATMGNWEYWGGLSTGSVRRTLGRTASGFS